MYIQRHHSKESAAEFINCEDYSVDLNSYNFESKRNLLFKKLNKRPSKEKLIECNILKNQPDTIASLLSKSCVSINFRLVKDELSHKLKNRPSRERLLSCNIIRFDYTISPLIQSKQSTLLFQQNQIKVAQKLYYRPSKERLVTSNIIQEGEPNTEQTIHRAHQSLKKRKRIDTVESHIRNLQSDYLDLSISCVNKV